MSSVGIGSTRSLRGWIVAGLLMWVASAPPALPQTGVSNLQSNVDDSAVDARNGDAKGSGKNPLKSEHPGAPKIIGNKPASVAIPAEVSPLSFQPGIGWQSTTASGPACGSALRLTRNSAGVLAPRSCSPETAHALSPIPRAGASQLGGSDVSQKTAQELGDHAYVSTIKLRRMMRKAPDLETRIELQELDGKIAGEHAGPLHGNKQSRTRKGDQKQELMGTHASRSTRASALTMRARNGVSSQN